MIFFNPQHWHLNSQQLLWPPSRPLLQQLIHNDVETSWGVSPPRWAAAAHQGTTVKITIYTWKPCYAAASLFFWQHNLFLHDAPGSPVLGWPHFFRTHCSCTSLTHFTQFFLLHDSQVLSTGSPSRNSLSIKESQRGKRQTFCDTHTNITNGFTN